MLPLGNSKSLIISKLIHRFLYIHFKFVFGSQQIFKIYILKKMIFSYLFYHNKYN